MKHLDVFADLDDQHIEDLEEDEALKLRPFMLLDSGGQVDRKRLLEELASIAFEYDLSLVVVHDRIWFRLRRGDLRRFRAGSVAFNIATSAEDLPPVVGEALRKLSWHNNQVRVSSNDLLAIGLTYSEFTGGR